jgi:hypothetical protein
MALRLSSHSTSQQSACSTSYIKINQFYCKTTAVIRSQFISMNHCTFGLVTKRSLCLCLTTVRCSPEQFMLLVKIERTINRHMQHKIQWMNNKHRAIVMFPGYKCDVYLWRNLNQRKPTEINYIFSKALQIQIWMLFQKSEKMDYNMHHRIAYITAKWASILDTTFSSHCYIWKVKQLFFF